MGAGGAETAGGNFTTQIKAKWQSVILCAHLSY